MTEYVIDLTGVEVKTGVTGSDRIAALWGVPLREEIVRCRDCKYYSDHEWVIVTDVSSVCHFWHGEPTKVEPNGFCKWGERRES